MRTVYDVKMALDYDTMVNVVNNYQKAQRKMAQQKPKRKKNRWDNVFPVCRNK